VRAARERERELKELERATRTVFVYNLNNKADERDIFEFFSKAGEVRVCRVWVCWAGGGLGAWVGEGE
jgi:RNA-binding protein 39